MKSAPIILFIIIIDAIDSTTVTFPSTTFSSYLFLFIDFTVTYFPIQSVC